jgi:hypothetical protein
LLYILLNLPFVQNYIAKKASDILAKKLDTRVSIKHTSFSLLNHISLEGLYIEDHQHDTLLYAGEVQVRITDWFFLRKTTPVLHYIGLHDAYAHLYRKSNDSNWNYNFVIDAFGGNKKSTTSKQSEFKFDLKKIDLKNVRFHMDDAWVGDDMDYNLGTLLVNVNDVDFEKKLVDVSGIEANKVAIYLKDYKGGRPVDTASRKRKKIIDTTAFNESNWAVKLNTLSLKECLFSLQSAEDVPDSNSFDATHLVVKNINVAASNININRDTLHGQIEHLSAKERCGLNVKELKTEVSVSPNASICKHLSLITNYSKIIDDYYAMHYKRFPDFENYITNVVMEAKLKDAIVDERDMAYFAPILRRYPTILHVSGDAKGTVADISANHLNITDGKSFIKGNIKMVGLPDIYKTFIEFKEGEIITTGNGILQYAPVLKDNPNIAIDKLVYAYFHGSYSGFIENFAVEGEINTNFGTIKSSIKMNLPGFSSNKAAYTGSITTDHYNIGALLKQPDLGYISLNADINGLSFDPDHMQIKTKATISKLQYLGYDYKKIDAQGTLARKQFTGNLIIDDPNLALAFYGNIDFSQKLVNINAKANLLKSNFNLLGLTKDTIQAVADFDLNCSGSNIDNFSGYAKLYNIDVRRNTRRLNLDSVYLHSSEEGTKKKLTVESNDIVATIKGDYQLTKLPYSVQYYLSKYLPNYISAPTKTAPDQNLTFEIKTKSVDSLLGVTTKILHGFDNSSIKGSLNTFQHRLTLNATSPFGAIGNYNMHDISVSGDGNFNSLALNAEVDKVVLGDSFLTGSLSMTTTIGNDSMRFNIATSSPETNISVTLNGQAVAHGDSLFFSLAPSEFFLNQVKWNIPAGNYIIYSNNYLLVENLRLESGLQKIIFSTERSGSDQTLSATIHELDLSQFGAWGGLAAYQPDGRINGNIKIDKLFSKFFISADIKATGVKFGNDTLGNINIAGNYDGEKKLVSLDPSTGIYRGNASVSASGNMSFYKETYQNINGKIQFTNTPLSWTSSFLIGYISKIGGALNGTVNIGGTSQYPDIYGNLGFTDAQMKIDFLGTTYTIPEGNVRITKDTIDLGEIIVHDIYKNTATLTGYIKHTHFKDMKLALRARSPQFQVIDLQSFENQIFYGNLIASFNPLSITGTFDNVNININKAIATQKSHIFLPMSSSTGSASYSYVTFKSYGKQQEGVKKNKNKLSINFNNTELNDNVELTLVLDPTTGDAINAKGSGTMQLEIPNGNDIRMFGTYNIEEGDYIFTLKKVEFKRIFKLEPGSTIRFKGTLPSTEMNVDGIYTVKARLYDLLNDADKQSGVMTSGEVTDAKTKQDVNVILHMKGTLASPRLSYNIDLADNHSMGTYAYTRLERLNQDDAQLFNQVASLLLIGTFVPQEGISQTTATTTALNTAGDVVSAAASSQITNLINKILGDKNLQIDLKYAQEALNDPTGSLVRNELSLAVKKNYLNDRLIVELGGKSDWGRPASTSSTTNFNLTGDFRIQYLLTSAGLLRMDLFRTSDYDVTLNQDVIRSGVGIGWRKPFDNLSELFHSAKYNQRKAQLQKTNDSLKRRGLPTINSGD